MQAGLNSSQETRLSFDEAKAMVVVMFIEYWRGNAYSWPSGYGIRLTAVVQILDGT